MFKEYSTESLAEAGIRPYVDALRNHGRILKVPKSRKSGIQFDNTQANEKNI